MKGVGGKVELFGCKYVAGSKVNEGGCQTWKIWRPITGRSQGQGIAAPRPAKHLVPVI